MISDRGNNIGSKCIEAEADGDGDVNDKGDAGDEVMDDELCDGGKEENLSSRYGVAVAMVSSNG